MYIISSDTGRGVQAHDEGVNVKQSLIPTSEQRNGEPIPINTRITLNIIPGQHRKHIHTHWPLY